MTREDEIAARLAAATPGPWRDCSWDPMERPHVHKDTEGQQMCSPPDLPLTKADADFIVHAPDDIAYLLARVREFPEPYVFQNAEAVIAYLNSPDAITAWLASDEAQEQMAAALHATEQCLNWTRPCEGVHEHTEAAAILAALAAAREAG